jgi:uncharacterized protein (DUF2267 family)
MTNQKIAQELLEVLGNSQSHNPAWALKEVLEKLREKLSGQNPVDFKDELNVMYVLGYDDCLKDIDCIIDELEAL